ncbi:MAG: tetratricopeptide repeat protein, partial [Acidobacteriales bacterium]|nr:tetratricopeptide repeat protein [Terriglobales bacterium]
MKMVLALALLAVSSLADAPTKPAPTLDRLQAAAAAAPADPAAWENLGIGYAGAGKYDEAIRALKKALELKYPATTGQYNLACVYAKQGSPDSKREALAILKDLVATGNAAGLPIATDPDLAGIKGDPAFQQILQTLSASAEVCRDAAKHPEFRGLDFWVGEWDVHAPQHVQVGQSSVQLILKNCVVYENWSDTGGSQGKSFNKFNPQTQAWGQFWVDDKGHTTFYIGKASAGQVRYSAESKNANGSRLLRHLTFTKLDADRVEQKEEVSTDDGKTWSVGYDFTYVRKALSPG